MKKIYSIVAVVAATISANAQTPLNTNGSLEDWTDASTAPTGWFINASLLSSNAVSKATGDAQEGNNYLKIVAPSSSNVAPGLEDINVTAGGTYTMSYWYKELNNGNIRFRHWGQFRNDTAAVTSVENPFTPSEYISDTNGEWTNVTVSGQIPEGVTKIRWSFRAFPQNNQGGGEIGIDNVVFYQGTASLAENNIEGLTVYPNPATDIVNITSFSMATKTVQIFDLVGKKVMDVETTESINVANLNKGIYVMKIQQEGKTATSKLVVK